MKMEDWCKVASSNSAIEILTRRPSIFISWPSANVLPDQEYGVIDPAVSITIGWTKAGIYGTQASVYSFQFFEDRKFQAV